MAYSNGQWWWQGKAYADGVVYAWMEKPELPYAPAKRHTWSGE